MEAQDVLSFWFDELDPKQWWKKSEQLDQEIKNRFEPTLRQARACELSHWRNRPDGRLAEIIVLDQFSRNIFRDKADAFESDQLALGLSQEAYRYRVHEELLPKQRMFLYMPFMHSESVVIHKTALEIFSNVEGLKDNLEFEVRHKKIVDRFGRYPHRNKILGRKSTEEELMFLKEPGSSF